MSPASLLRIGACAKVVDNDPEGGINKDGNYLRPLTTSTSTADPKVKVGVIVEILDSESDGSLTPPYWWVVRVLTGTHRNKVGWMAETQPGTEYYNLQEVACP